ncbi:TSUP family transporter [Nitrospira sp. Nam74]
MDISLLQFVAATVVIAMGSTVQAATGVGAGLFVVPLLALINLNFVPGPVILASLWLSTIMAITGRNAIDRAHLHTVTMGLFIGMVVGVLSLTRLDSARIGTMFGILILVAALATGWGLKFPFTTVNALIAGAVSGFMGVIAAVGGPVLALLYQYEKGQTLRATLAFLYLFSSVCMLLLLYFVDRFQWQEVWLGLGLVPGILIGYAMASFVTPELDRGHSRQVVLAISMASALALIVKSLL